MTGQQFGPTLTTNRLAPGRSKVPAVLAIFWITKALTTALGESTSDFLVHAMPPVAAVLAGFVVFCLALSLQLRSPRYSAARYWFAVAMVGVFGTMAADVLHVGFGVPYPVSAVLFAVALAAVFVLWYRLEGTLSVHSIDSRRRELFYWAAVVTTFALGTAVGDLTAYSFGLGYAASTVLFAVLITLPAIGYRLFALNAVAAFWSAYVLTRPLGASVADWLGKPTADGGIGIGAGVVSLVLAAVIAAIVVHLARSGADAPGDEAG
ncbi:MAG TPA: hypothetical protein VGH43_02870 [Jatrophihabitans sp.]